MRKGILSVVIMCNYFFINAQQQPGLKIISQRRIDSVVISLMKAGEVPGLCLGIIRDNKPVFVKAYGWKNREAKVLNDTATIFHAASFSKSLFAYFVMILVDDGLIELDKPLYQYLNQPIPAYKGYEDLEVDERWKQITARHCLSHTTGFPNWRWLNPKGNNKLELFFTPGQRYAYSGEGLQLLQMVIEHITGRDLESLINEKVFQPLGMRRSSFVWQLRFENNYALPYDENMKVLDKIKRAEVYVAGSLETTIADYTRFISAVLKGKGISERSKKEMFSPQIEIKTRQQFPSLNNDTTGDYRKIHLSYGLGWGLYSGSYGSSFFKEGHVDGWENYTIGFPDKGYALVVMTNSSNGESIFRYLITAIIGDASIPWDWEGYTSYQPFITLPASKLVKYTGVYKRDDVEASIILEQGQLYVESAMKGLPKTLLYASNDTVFFIKQFQLQFEFIRDEMGNVVKVKVYDEGEEYEMEKKRK